MPKTLSEVSKLQALIQPEVLAKHGFPKPERVLLLEQRDSTDLDSYYVYVVYPEKTPDDALRRAKIAPVEKWVKQTIYDQAGYERYPYVWVRRPSELPPGL